MSKNKISAHVRQFENEAIADFTAQVKEGSLVLASKQVLIGQVVDLYQSVTGGQPDDPKIRLAQTFALALMGPDYNNFVSAYRQGAADIRNHRLEPLMGRLEMELLNSVYDLAACSEAQAWEDLAKLNRKMAESIEVWTAIAVQAQELLKHEEAAADAAELAALAVSAMRNFQLLAVLEAPAADVTRLWGQESKATVKLYADLLKAMAALRGDAAVTQAVDALVAPAPAAKKTAKLKKSSGPKR